MVSLVAGCLLAVITRADLVERFRAAPVVKCEGLVQVSGMCSTEIRREFQQPIATYAANLCRLLYRALGVRERKFTEPCIMISLGDDTTTNRTVEVSFRRSAAGAAVATRLKLPSPAFTDRDRLQLEIVKAFLLAVNGETADDARAREILDLVDPDSRIDAEYRELAEWREQGRLGEGRDDEYYLKLLRRVKNPGQTRREDVLLLASRLYLYPSTYALPFCGRYSSCTFREAIEFAPQEVGVRLAAYRKCSELTVFGAGHDERLTATVRAYVEFLTALAAQDKSREELLSLLETAEALLKAAMPSSPQ